MSIYAIVWAYQQPIANSGQKFTLVTAAQYCNDEGICWVKQETLAEDTSMGISTVRKHLAALEEAGIIQRIERRRSDGTRSSDFIKLCAYSNRSNRAADPLSTAQIEQTNRSNRAGNKRHSETLLTTTTRDCLKILNSVPLFPRDEADNAERLEAYQKEFPDADAVEVCKDYAAHCKEKPIKKGEKPRLKLRNFFKQADKPKPQRNGGNNGKKDKGTVAPVSSNVKEGYEWLFN
jgi:DNA-binding MarR family transcriptional regulator